jgi:hypothetical protein
MAVVGGDLALAPSEDAPSPRPRSIVETGATLLPGVRGWADPLLSDDGLGDNTPPPSRLRATETVRIKRRAAAAAAVAAGNGDGDASTAAATEPMFSAPDKLQKRGYLLHKVGNKHWKLRLVVLQDAFLLHYDVDAARQPCTDTPCERTPLDNTRLRVNAVKSKFIVVPGFFWFFVCFADQLSISVLLQTIPRQIAPSTRRVYHPMAMRSSASPIPPCPTGSTSLRSARFCFACHEPVFMYVCRPHCSSSVVQRQLRLSFTKPFSHPATAVAAAAALLFAPSIFIYVLTKLAHSLFFASAQTCRCGETREAMQAAVSPGSLMRRCPGAQTRRPPPQLSPPPLPPQVPLRCRRSWPRTAWPASCGPARLVPLRFSGASWPIA